MKATGEQKLLILTESHEVVLLLDKGDPDPLRTLHIVFVVVVVNNNKNQSHVVDNIIFGISVPDYPI